MRKEEFLEFRDFVETTPKFPSGESTRKIDRRVEKDLHPEHWYIITKFTLIQFGTGMLTLTICPQFEMGFGGHNELLHQLHLLVSPFAFFLICGILFVVLGASISCLVFSREENRAIRKSRYPLFVIYSLFAYLTFMLLGADVFFLYSFFWIIGGILGNILGFNLTERIKLLVRQIETAA